MPDQATQQPDPAELLRREADQAIPQLQKHLTQQDKDLQAWQQQVSRELEALKQAIRTSIPASLKKAIAAALKGRGAITTSEASWVKALAATTPADTMAKLVAFLPLFQMVAQERIDAEEKAIERAKHLSRQLETIKKGFWVIISGVTSVGAIVIAGALYIRQTIGLAEFATVIVLIVLAGVVGVMVLNNVSAQLARRIQKGQKQP